MPHAAPPAPVSETPPPYPVDSDAKIRQVATVFHRPDIIRMLDDIRTRLLGDALGVEALAAEFAKNKTLYAAKEDIGKAVQAVSGTWSGRAADQFTTYASRVGEALDKEQSAVGKMSGILGEVAKTVIHTYAEALRFLGRCATELGKLFAKGLIAIVTAEVPILDVITSKDVLDTVIDAFSTFVDGVVGLFAKAEEQIGDFVKNANALVQNNTDFPEIPELPGNSGMDNDKQWKINPSAFPE
ncbi:WXG100 family type VII secretion target [Amycolatopsis samaneae]|uniref:WXG100 family type VII secretion target n=1 Tax=Amycolatopsis samaneae TaxID=664691 RepID=A0ABW5G8I9_9PSEU